MSLSDWNIAKAIVFVDIPKLILWRKINSSPKKTFIKTISGPIISVSDAVGGPPESLVANIDLTQEGSGDPSPDTYTALGPSDIVSFTAAANDRIKNFTVNIEPVQSGSGDPSPDNVRPITGWTGASVRVTGKNLWDDRLYALANWTLVTEGERAGYYNGNTWEFCRDVFGKDGSYGLGLLGVKKEYGRLTISFDSYPISGSIRVFFHYSDGTSVNTSGNITGKQHVSYSSNPNKNCVGVSISTTVGATATTQYFKNLQIEIGNEETEYVPYDGTTYPVSWETEAGEIYGGTLDVLTGTLTVDKVKKTVLSVNTKDNRYGIVYLGAYGSVFPNYKSNAYCNLLKEYTGVSSQITDYSYEIFDSPARNRSILTIRFDGTESETADYNATLSALNEAGTPLEVVYQFTEPLAVYQLTPQQITTLLGANNIWADCGQTSLTHVAPGNIRPITGVSSISVHPAGASAEYTYERGGLNDSGEEATSSSYNRSTYIDVHGSNNVYMQYSAPSGAWVMRVCAYNKDKEFLSLMRKQTHSANSTWNTTLTIPDDAAYIRFSVKFSATMDICVFDYYSNVQLALVSEIYSGNVKFNKDGSADIYCDKQYCVLDGNSVISEYYAATDSTRMGCIFANVLPFASPNVANQTGLIANWAVRETTASNAEEKNVSHWSVRSGNSGDSKDLYLYAPYGTAVTESELLEMLTDNPLQVVIPIATPQTYHIDAEDVPDITLFQGKNTIWSDTGDVELTYEAESE